MHIARKAVVPVLALLLLAGCSRERQDIVSGNSVYEMKSSISILAQDLPADRRDEFERAVETIMLSTTDRRLSLDGDRLSPQAMSLLKGRTVSQVIENAKLIRSASSSL
jgi:outer membrane murein-binding lipoprotein Lpp